MPRRPLAAAPSAPNSTATPLPRRGFLGKVVALVAGGALFGRVKTARAATQGAEPFLGEIMLWAGNFAPQGWAFCDGQILSIAQNTALFSLLGTNYGGNGQTTFALPDLRGRAPIHMGQGPGLPPYTLGQVGGEPSHTLAAQEMPQHTHTARADSANGTSDTPTGLVPSRNPAGIPAYGSGLAATLAAGAIDIAGGSQPHNNMPPYLTLNYCIALQGIFPSRS